MGIHNTALIGASSQGYQIQRSVRLRSSASAYLNRTPASATNRRTWTWSGWVKRGLLSSGEQVLFSAGSSYTTQTYFTFYIGSDNKLVTSTGTAEIWRTTQVFRDPAAWYHMVLVVDTTQATADNRTRLYINGTEVTSFSRGTNLSLNTDYGINYNIIHYIGRDFFQPIYFDGYQTEVNFIDGQALTPSSFGETNAVTGVWQPKKYAGTYGTNGFYLNFSDNSASTAAAIGKDYSGNGNNWTPNIISVTAGATYDSMLDTPTPFVDGDNGRGNYATLNPVGSTATSIVTLSGGNLNFTHGALTNRSAYSTIGMSSGKWYCELVYTTAGGSPNPGLSLDTQATTANYIGQGSAQYSYEGGSGNKITGGVSTAYGSGWAINDVIGIAFDANAGTLTFYKNNVSQGAITGLAAGTYVFGVTSYNGGTGSINFGQRPFSYTPPTGFLALNTQNLPAPTILNGARYMAATLYTGTGAGLTISNAVNNISFQPDFVWIKVRSTTYNHNLYDALRGTSMLASNLTNAENPSGSPGDLTTYNAGGFSIQQTGNYELSHSADTYVAWQWNAGGSTVTNTSGTISAQVRANPTAGFSIVTYTGTGANATVGHGLGVTPSMVIVKARSTTGNWCVTMPTLGANNVPFLDLTNAAASFPTVFNGLPTSTIFNIGTAGSTNTNAATHVAYCFAAVAGYSAFGSYTGNGSTDGPFVFLGFRPRFVLFKKSSGADDWIIYDTTRDTYNVTSKNLYANGSFAEDTNTTNRAADILSNGFKIRSSATYLNLNAATFIYMAFAENPFKNSLAR